LEHVQIPFSENKYHHHLKKSRHNLLVSSGYRDPGKQPKQSFCNGTDLFKRMDAG
jgi:hypothetical protein